MRAAILSLFTAAALFATTNTADARPFRHWGGYRGGYYGYRHYPSYYGGYGGYRGYGYYPRYYGGYYNNYYNPGGFRLNLGPLSIGTGGYAYPYYGGYWW